MAGIAATFEVSFKVLGKTISGNVNLGGEYCPLVNTTINGAKSGQLTTRTNDTSGVLTMTSGHGITTDSDFDFYCTIDGVPQVISCIAGTVSGNTVPITGASPDLPLLNAVGVGAVPKFIPLGLNGDENFCIACQSEFPCNIIFWLSDLSNGVNIQMLSLPYTYIFVAPTGNFGLVQLPAVNPLAGFDTIGFVSISNGSTQPNDVAIATLSNQN